jgi:predicted nucleotidyltransferase
MVWSQYVYEATVDLDSYASGDEDDGHDITPLNIEDWEVEYSEELGFMWNMINTLLYDARIRHSGEFCDFVEFCYDEHDPYRERETSDYDVQLAHIWKNIRRVVNDNGLHEDMMRGATFYHFVAFANNFMYLY